MEQKLESDPRRKLRPQTNPHRLSNFSPLLPLSSLNTRRPAPCCILSPSISLCIFCPWTTHIRGHKPHTWNKELRGRCRLDKIKNQNQGWEGAVRYWQCKHEELIRSTRTWEKAGSGDVLEMQGQEDPATSCLASLVELVSSRPRLIKQDA